MAANTIEPAIGASTCAFGNHKCVVNIGNFTRNPSIVNNQNKDEYDKELGNKISEGMDIIKWFE
jgi:hypothetical protein